jgi:hypothetical protein
MKPARTQILFAQAQKGSVKRKRYFESYAVDTLAISANDG